MKFKGDRIGLFHTTSVKLFTFLLLSISITSCQVFANDSKVTVKANSPIDSKPTPTVNPAEVEIELYIRAISLGQQAYFLENTKFSSTIEEMGIGSVPITPNYDLKIAKVEKNHSQMTATAKKAGLKSYTASVFVIDERKGTTVGVICSSDKPSPIPPEMPAAPKSFSEKPDCPGGSHIVVAKPNL